MTVRTVRKCEGKEITALTSKKKRCISSYIKCDKHMKNRMVKNVALIGKHKNRDEFVK